MHSQDLQSPWWFCSHIVPCWSLSARVGLKKQKQKTTTRINLLIWVYSSVCYGIENCGGTNLMFSLGNCKSNKPFCHSKLFHKSEQSDLIVFYCDISIVHHEWSYSKAKMWSKHNNKMTNERDWYVNGPAVPLSWHVTTCHHINSSLVSANQSDDHMLTAYISTYHTSFMIWGSRDLLWNTWGHSTICSAYHSHFIYYTSAVWLMARCLCCHRVSLFLFSQVPPLSDCLVAFSRVWVTNGYWKV